MYYTYMLRCSDGSIYTGVAADLEKRMKVHFSQDEEFAKYTKSHHPLKLERAWQSENRSSAQKLEYRIKSLTKMQKEELIASPEKIDVIISQKLDCTSYKNVI